jgi:hypothetical protein
MTKGDKPVEQNITQSIPESPDLTNVTMTRGDNTIDKLNTTRISKFGKYEYIAWINHHRKYNDASLNDKDKPELKKIADEINVQIKLGNFKTGSMDNFF